MSRYTGSIWKVSRRLNYSLSETGKELIKRPYAPGMHGKKRIKAKDYGLQLQEKQKVRFTYGISEKQFKKIFKDAGKLKGIHGEMFLFLLESRLDNVVYRLGFAKTRQQARQLVNHGHILVDGKKVDIPSYSLRVGQIITLKEKSKDLIIVKEALANKLNRVDYISLNKELVGKYVRIPHRDELLPNIKEQLIVEFYNRK
ncbi:SSU ribosomal protein S4 [Candidatus Phytoplasma mali]|uniref:Small ribosomal subunit protein uS4 n=1 Tax=Phytoplasma mali (strain AT) TaxID=482235 RepID=RS4_PHYMT|nr:30S ribosomal protein S4 [Candidatus Phytoplasma mali]B3QZW0.1 RecName: Full=Small ribosomal subunit protein uS4; AltName: Full=30S ribosomal protein S4 [Candidatus Phytoplasma mali AT]CAP18497.1 SSU ribosomal protein S4 [Candidatus Phytoplasma mali]